MEKFNKILSIIPVICYLLWLSMIPLEGWQALPFAACIGFVCTRLFMKDFFEI